MRFYYIETKLETEIKMKNNFKKTISNKNRLY